jgi:4-hydroxybenzoate polyprenyltransferase
MNACPGATVASGSWPRARLRVLALGLAEARPQVQLAFLLRFACGAALSAPVAGYSLARFVGGLLVWECVVVAVYLFNGIADVTGDRMNGSHRPIAHGRLAPGAAGLLTAAFACVALAGSLMLGNAFTIATVGALLLGYLYSGRPFDLRKRPIAASALALAGGLITYVAGSLAIEQRLTATAAVLALAMSLWMGIVGATAKDFADRAGDAATGRQTLMSRFSEAVAIGLALAVAAWFLAQILLTAAVAVLAGGMVVAVRTRRTAGAAQRKVLAGPYRAFMATQLTAHALVLTVVLASQFAR